MARLPLSIGVWVMILLASLVLSPPLLMGLEKPTSKEHIENFIWINVLFKMLLPKSRILPRLIVARLFACLIVVPFLFGVGKASVRCGNFFESLTSLRGMVFVWMEFYCEFFVSSFKIILGC